jgi:lipoate-protein ligase A
MSVDEALLDHSLEQGPTLRFYTWRSATVSLGYRQREPAWLSRCRDLRIEVVRRVTGGGAVLHGADLTYAIVVPHGCEDLPSDLHGSYTWIRDVLMTGLRSEGLRVSPARGSPGADRQTLCFEGSLGVEIELDGQKLVGSAQRRTPQGLLQHGSIRLADDSGLYRQLFDAHLPPPPREIAGQSGEKVQGWLIEAFQAALGRPLLPGVVTPSEYESARTRHEQRRISALAA